MAIGTVKWWNCDRGDGFLEVEGEDVYLHHAAMLETADPQPGARVECDVVAGLEGSVAANAKVLKVRRR